MLKNKQITSTSWEEYELMDAGGGKKLERWGKIITIRPEVNAYFRSGMPFEEWYKLYRSIFNKIISKNIFL